MSPQIDWSTQFGLDIDFGYVGSSAEGPRNYNPRLVMNEAGSTVEHALVEELARCNAFTFSVAFITPGAIAQLKQHLHDFNGPGTIVTSDFLGFNQPQAFAELLKLNELKGIDVRRHPAQGFHAKGYVFEHDRSVTAIIGSSNLTSAALSTNHEWNLRVSAAHESDLANQIRRVLEDQSSASEPLTQEWIDSYAATYLAPAPRVPLTTADGSQIDSAEIQPNGMQRDALLALDLVRSRNAERAIIVSATGTGKTILSALDVRQIAPERLLFVVHREQILDKTISEYQRVLGGSPDDYGKLSGSSKQAHRRYVFATIQTLSGADVLSTIAPDAFDLVIIDEAHRAGSATYQRIISHLTPRFLLGMTATPERTDGFNVYELFHYNVPYEIRLHHALEAGMLCPFHYYGIADVTYDDGTTTTQETELKLLINAKRVEHLLSALDQYGQAGVAPRGLIFCSRKEEAHALAAELNRSVLRGKPLRTVALTGDDSVHAREQRVQQLEAGELDYILTVDVFNEGVDIPTVNQVVMLRQTQSAIVFVQQLGRGLRLAEDKDHLVVIDFIGNYATNFLVPIALFGDESLNRESLREKLNETIEAGALPGLSSVSFDEVARERVLRSIAETTLDSLSNLKTAMLAMKNRVGGIPTLWDFYRFESVDPVLLATKKAHFPQLVRALLREGPVLDEAGDRALALLSHEVLPAKRLNEYVVLELLLRGQAASHDEIREAFDAAELPSDDASIRAAVDTLALRGYSQGEVRRYSVGIVEEADDVVALTPAFATLIAHSHDFAHAVSDLMKTGRALTEDRYLNDQLFTPGMQYSRRDAARLVGWSRSTTSTIYGYKSDEALGLCTAFTTLHKDEDVAASTAYEDALLDPSTMRWFSKSNRTLESKDVKQFVEHRVDIHVFVKKDDADGSDHYYLGRARVAEAAETQMAGDGLPVVAMTLKFDEPIKQGLFDYFHPLPAQS
ncbi:DEAD/DEAH box helicase [Nocardioides lacusdianchii]|uniref:DEAD/DEAH box helicase n=1 Tax=Nocardioides lacusdianchii TaxID=2783664 RepID=UPI001CCA7C31|nr:DEAD/DEAH box helicase [Nocardioides lacusdianchii]